MAFLIDEGDRHVLASRTWRKRKSGYVTAATHVNGKYVVLYLHRVLLNAKPGQYVDHINGDRSDNRRANLRLCTQSQNCMNSRKQNRPTSSIYKGVCFYKSRNKWVANIRIRGKNLNLGYFATEREAARAYNNAAIEHGNGYFKLNDL